MMLSGSFGLVHPALAAGEAEVDALLADPGKAPARPALPPSGPGPRLRLV